MHRKWFRQTFILCIMFFYPCWWNPCKDKHILLTSYQLGNDLHVVTSWIQFIPIWYVGSCTIATIYALAYCTILTIYALTYCTILTIYALTYCTILTIYALTYCTILTIYALTYCIEEGSHAGILLSILPCSIKLSHVFLQADSRATSEASNQVCDRREVYDFLKVRVSSYWLKCVCFNIIDINTQNCLRIFWN